MNVAIDQFPLHLVRFDADQFQRISSEGILRDGPAVDLYEGLLVEKEQLGARTANSAEGTPPGPEEFPLVQINVHQMYEMVRAGIIEEGAPIELIDGLLVYKDRSSYGEDFMTVSPQHALAIEIVAELLRQMIAGLGVHVRCQQPLLCGDDNHPEPDLLIAVGRPQAYAKMHPSANDVPLVIEVADSSLPADRRRKLELYAQGGILQYWIVNLRNQSIEVYTQPLVEERTYETINVYHPGERLPFEVLGQSFELDPSMLFLSALTDSEN